MHSEPLLGHWSFSHCYWSILALDRPPFVTMRWKMVRNGEEVGQLHDP